VKYIKLIVKTKYDLNIGIINFKFFNNFKL